jgi:hypothetical protein
LILPAEAGSHSRLRLLWLPPVRRKMPAHSRFSAIVRPDPDAQRVCAGLPLQRGARRRNSVNKFNTSVT